MILIYSPEVTPRLSYIFNFIFREILLTEITFTTSPEDFEKYPGAKLVYDDKPSGSHLFFKANKLLAETGIQPQAIELLSRKDHKVFFQVTDGALPFDPFAAAFYLVSRYEEYLPGTRDHHQRYRPEESVAWKGEFLNKPVIDIWANEIKSIISARFPEYTFPAKRFRFTPTLDIDNAYAFKFKGFTRNSARLTADFFTFHLKRSLARFKVLLKLEKDPYDSYEKIRKIHQKYNLRAIFFFLLGDPGKHDRNLSDKNPEMIRLIKEIQSNAQIGIHPSYGSNSKPELVETEKKRLENIAGESVTRSRQHYIKLTFPQTYRTLINAGITEDYSMGYPSVCGFRAGTCTPFMFYDLEKETVTGLKVHSFAFMDTTLKVYLKKRSSQIIEYLKPFIEEVKKAEGELVFIFHNESIGTAKMWKNWESMYEDVIRQILKD